MGNINAKKIAAAISAVNFFLEEEKSLLISETHLGAEPPIVVEETLKEIRDNATGWAYLGRAQSMNTRTFWQLKLYK